MGPPSFMRSVVHRNVFMLRMTLQSFVYCYMFRRNSTFFRAPVHQYLELTWLWNITVIIIIIIIIHIIS